MRRKLRSVFMISFNVYDYISSLSLCKMSCPICLTDEAMVKLKCGHFFHAQCLGDLARHSMMEGNCNMKCPYCRLSYTFKADICNNKIFIGEGQHSVCVCTIHPISYRTSWVAFEERQDEQAPFLPFAEVLHFSKPKSVRCRSV